MNVGVNYPWNNFGADFGDPPPGWGQRRDWERTLATEIDHLRTLGVRALRWFILADGLLLGTGAGAVPHVDRSRPGQWRFDQVPQLTTEFVQDFRRLLGFFSADLQLMPVLMSFEFCRPGEPTGQAAYVKQGRSDVVYDPAKSIDFRRNVFDRLLAITAEPENRPKILAWDIFNEPELCTRASNNDPDLNHTIPIERMREFLRECASRVNAVQLDSTVGFQHRSSVEEWNRDRPLGLTMQQFHYYGYDYGRPAPLPRFDPALPCMLGEIGTSVFVRSMWPDHGWHDSVHRRLSTAFARGYQWVFLWSRHSTSLNDHDTEWDRSTEAALAAIRDGNYRPDPYQPGRAPRDAGVVAG
ncbi:MAG: hypothetical protein V7609_1205 [Verrucomicrobiota bacterium]